MRITRYTLLGLIMAVFCLAGARQAHAYGKLTVHYARVDTGTCHRLSGDLTVIAHSNGCELPDSIDGTFFEKDAGGIAVKVVLSDSSGVVAKVEFHPAGEVLWLYDTRNDGDTVYTKVCVQNSTNRCTRATAPTGTSDAIDIDVINLDYAEGTNLDIIISDDMDNGASTGDIYFFDSARA